MEQLQDRTEWDLLVVGAGPCGIAVGVAARERNLRCIHLDQGSVAHSIVRYPTYTTFFSGAEKLEIGDLPFTIADDKPTRREALRYFRRVVEYFDLEVRQYEKVVSVEGRQGDFRVLARDAHGDERSYRARNVVIATGYFDTPNRLEVPGADLPKVSYYFKEPFEYYGQDVLVVGGGNSAADAALSCWREGANVTLVHLGAELDSGIKPWVRPDIENRIREGSIPVIWEHRVSEVRPHEVELSPVGGGPSHVVPNDWVLSMTGYVPDTGLLQSLGVEIDATTGVPSHDPETMGTNVPGVYIAGVIAAGWDANRIFIENGKLHGAVIAASVPARDP